MRTFIDIVMEAPAALPGDLDVEIIVGELSLLIYQRDWSKVGSLATNQNQYDIIKSNFGPTFKVGRVQETSYKGRDGMNAGKLCFATVLHMKLDAAGPQALKLGSTDVTYKNIYKVDVVGVDKGTRGENIATSMYVWMISQGMTILGDSEQYFGARRLWSSLSKRADIVVDVIDIDRMVIVERNAVLRDSIEDEDFDPAVWSYAGNRENIRLLLRGIVPIS